MFAMVERRALSLNIACVKIAPHNALTMQFCFSSVAPAGLITGRLQQLARVSTILYTMYATSEEAAPLDTSIYQHSHRECISGSAAPNDTLR